MESKAELIPTPESERQSGISIILIAVIIVMMIVYMTCTYSTENEQIFQVAAIPPIIAFLLGIYTFSYRGKAYLIARILFIIFLILSAISIFAIVYLIGLAEAYQH